MSGKRRAVQDLRGIMQELEAEKLKAVDALKIAQRRVDDLRHRMAALETTIDLLNETEEVTE